MSGLRVPGGLTNLRQFIRLAPKLAQKKVVRLDVR